MFEFFYRTYSYFCNTSLLNVHKLSKLKEGRVRNSGTHVFKTKLELFNCIFSSSSSGFQIFFWYGKKVTFHLFFFSSPEHEVLMVSYCGQWLSVVRRRPSSVVRRPSCVNIWCLHSRGHICNPIFIKLCQNVCFDNI